jgi:predicted metal-binding protein
MAVDRPDPAADGSRTVRRPWRSSLVLVCRECDGARGFGPKQVRKALTADAKAHLPAKAVRVATVSCLDVCPKRAVTVAVVGVGETAVTIGDRAGAGRLVDRIGRAIVADGAP